MSNMLRIVGKDEVQKPVWDFPVGIKSLSSGILLEDDVLVANHNRGLRVVYREDTMESLGVVRGNYRLLPHGDAINRVMDVLTNLGHNPLDPKVTLVDNGARMYAQIYFDAPNSVDVFENNVLNDVLKPGILIVNSLNGSTKFRIEFSIWRLVCSNGLRLPQVLISESALHTKNVGIDALLEKALDGIDEKFSKAVGPMMKLMQYPLESREMAQAAAETFIGIEGGIFPKRYLVDVMRYYDTEREKTLWNLYNAFNSVINHSVIGQANRVDRGMSLDQNLFNTFTDNVGRVYAGRLAA